LIYGQLITVYWKQCKVKTSSDNKILFWLLQQPEQVSVSITDSTEWAAYCNLVPYLLSWVPDTNK